MSLTSVKLEQVDQRTKKIIFGYVRQMQQILNCNENTSFYIISELVIHKLISFYFTPEYFSQCGEDIEISGSYKQTIKKVSKDRNWKNTSYGQIWHPSTDKIIAKWTFRVNEFNFVDKFDVTHNALFGIVTKDTHLNDDFSEDSNHKNYMFCNDGAVWEHTRQTKSAMATEITVVQGDIVTITLDLIKREIMYQVKNVSCVLHEKIIQEENTKYKIAVSLLETGNSVTLLNYECIQVC